ncbi:putative tlc domain-containing protein [Phaeomoniella chlamydospora]|uniref:Putative tlc domain-containing protein n=1 Tax=Phaeomoniella chlamydospora TaxID=158046 RepID=A0A0G2ETR2_PHACM|nr:putative tlc domain-containing protein [Phaeomoniella chlamydospora]
MHIWYHSPYWLNLAQLWANFPVREMEGLTKWYYLVQFAFWLQQIVVVNIEERRKDHWQMFTHHIITCALIFTSYGYHQSAAGNVILCLMDIGDILLAVAKLLKYMKFTTFCDVTFGVFMVTWFIARHILYMMVCWSIYADLPHQVSYGCYRGSDTNLQGPFPAPNDWDHLLQPFYDPEGTVCMNDNIRLAFLSLLLSLQVILVIWFGMIIKVAYKVISGQGAGDVRSDDEEEDENEEDSPRDNLERISGPIEKAAFIEQEVGVEEMDFRRSSSSSSRRKTKSPVSARGSTGAAGGSSNATTATASTGVSLRPGDRKELLGRIGCDKG